MFSHDQFRKLFQRSSCKLLVIALVTSVCALAGLFLSRAVISAIEIRSKPRPHCWTSGYCSLKLNPSHFIGPLSSNIELKAALSSLAYKNEIILMMEFRADSAAQFLANFRKAGYGHILVLTNAEGVCRHLERVFAHLGCGWFPTPVFVNNAELSEMFTLERGVLQVLYIKQWFGLRIIRMGYNVMMIDSGERCFE